MFSLLSEHINKSYRLYRDEYLAILKNNSGPEAEKLKKKFQNLVKEKDLDIVVQCNLEITNYLDITLNLNDDLNRPYRKTNEKTNYIHVNLDHPPWVMKEIPWSIKTLKFVIITKYFLGVSYLLWKTPKKQGIQKQATISST